MQKKHHVIVVAGPTASGKSDFAVELALKHNGEIISADSRQIYKGLDIGTGKITQEEMMGVPHYMLDVCDVGTVFSVAEYARMALPIIDDIISQGKTPIICGGTGQYIDALIFTTSLPNVEPNYRLREALEKQTTEHLYHLLMKKDAARAERIDKHNRVRLIRALEIVETLGTVPKQETPSLRYAITIYLMNPSREVLRARIRRRMEKRLTEGMIKEVSSILSKGHSEKELKRFGIEYTVIADYLNKKIDEATMKELLVTKSMQYAKRQQTWNKKYLPIAKVVEMKE